MKNLLEASAIFLPFLEALTSKVSEVKALSISSKTFLDTEFIAPAGTACDLTWISPAPLTLSKKESETALAVTLDLLNLILILLFFCHQMTHYTYLLKNWN